jgi:hypothetical protein
MRVFTRILKIFLSIVFVLSIILNIILGSSSTTFSIFSNKKKAFAEMYYTSFIALSNFNSITVESTMPYTAEMGYTSKDKLTCKIVKENDSAEYKCQMISKLYNSESDLVKTSYFPGDGYKYTAENNTYIKTAYDNENLVYYLSAFISGATNNLNYLLLDSASAETYSLKTTKGLYFDLNSFSLNKKASASYGEGEGKNTIKYKCNSRDRISYIKDTTNKATLKFTYSYIKLPIPDLIGYSAK